MVLLLLVFVLMLIVLMSLRSSGVENILSQSAAMSGLSVGVGVSVGVVETEGNSCMRECS